MYLNVAYETWSASSYGPSMIEVFHFNLKKKNDKYVNTVLFHYELECWSQLH